MRMFHIDMNVQHFTRTYLEQWLTRLAELGYDAILWELENGVCWETCPECVAADAFSKKEFHEILAFSRRLGLTPVPLFQTLAHCEYVLAHEPYAVFRESPDRTDQYCPLQPNLIAFLHRWIEEYLELFGEVSMFHLGADEAWTMGSCPKCRGYVDKHSKSKLYIDHVTSVAKPLWRRGITPAIWADMLLTHPETLDQLPRHFSLFDWHYELRRGMPQVQVWGPGMTSASALTPETLARFGRWLYPDGNEPGRDPDPFFNATYLRDKGFRVVGCSGSSSYGDNVFAPRHWLHVVNTADWVRTVADAGLAGFLETSWSVHLFPWELQLGAIAVPAFLREDADADLAAYPDWFAACFLGQSSGRAFWEACGLLAKPCLFTQTATLGFSKTALPTPRGWFLGRLCEIRRQERGEAELANCRERLSEYRQAMRLFARMRPSTEQGKVLLGEWRLAADALVQRAEMGILLLENLVALTDRNGILSAPAKRKLSAALARMCRIRSRFAVALRGRIKPTRRRHMLGWMFDALHRELRAWE
jgi:hypothetical protein